MGLQVGEPKPDPSPRWRVTRPGCWTSTCCLALRQREHDAAQARLLELAGAPAPGFLSCGPTPASSTEPWPGLGFAHIPTLIVTRAPGGHAAAIISSSASTQPRRPSARTQPKRQSRRQLPYRRRKRRLQLDLGPTTLPTRRVATRRCRPHLVADRQCRCVAYLVARGRPEGACYPTSAPHTRLRVVS